MPLRSLTIACIALAALLSVAACAKKLDTFAGSIDLPFDFHVKYRTDEASNSTLDFTASQRIRVVVDSGPLQGSEAIVVASYFVPSRGDAGDYARKYAAQAAASNMQSVQLDGFPFVLFTTDASGDSSRTTAGQAPASGDDGVGESGGPWKSTVMSGPIHNAMLTLSFVRPANAALDASANKAVAGFELDFASILRARSRFDDAARNAVANRKMLTPTGEYTAIGNMTPRLYSTWAKFDGSGTVVASRSAYSFSKAGFWAAEHMAFGSSCSLEGAQGAMARESHTTPDSNYSRVVTESAPMRGRIGGLAATRIDSQVASTVSGLVPKSAGSRWIATDHDTWYAFDFLTTKSADFERDLESQIDARPLACAPKAWLVLDDRAAQATATP